MIQSSWQDVAFIDKKWANQLSVLTNQLCDVLAGLSQGYIVGSLSVSGWGLVIGLVPGAWCDANESSAF